MVTPPNVCWQTKQPSSFLFLKGNLPVGSTMFPFGNLNIALENFCLQLIYLSQKMVGPCAPHRRKTDSEAVSCCHRPPFSHPVPLCPWCLATCCGRPAAPVAGGGGGKAGTTRRCFDFFGISNGVSMRSRRLFWNVVWLDEKISSKISPKYQ